MHHRQKALRDRQPKAGALHGAVDVQIHALELREQLFHILRLDADAGIRNGNLQVYGPADFRPVARRCADLHTYGAVIGVFNGVDQYVGNDLPHVRFISVQAVGQCLLHMDQELESLLLRFDKDQVADVAEHGTEPVVSFDDACFPCFDFGKIENVVDDGQQVFARPVYVSGVGSDRPEGREESRAAGFGCCLRLMALPQHHLIHAQDRVDGGPDLMGHVRKEAALRLVRLVRGLLLQFQQRSLISLLLLLGAHLLDAAGIPLLPTLSEKIGQCDQRKDDKADEDIDHKLLPDFRKLFLLADDDDGIPLIHDGLNEHGIRLPAEG